MSERNGRKFYESIDRTECYNPETDPVSHPFYRTLIAFLGTHQMEGKRSLEIGSSKGLFQKLVPDYTGLDISAVLSRYYSTKFVVATASSLPFQSESFDVIFTHATHEHVPRIENALEEITRVLKPGGACLFAPAWHTRPWFAQGYAVRRYCELGISGKLVKFSIAFRDCVFFRWPAVLARRVVRLFLHLALGEKPGRLRFRKLKPNYAVYHQSDSDACNSLDPFDVVIWFKSRGFVCKGYESRFKAIFMRTRAIELIKTL